MTIQLTAAELAVIMVALEHYHKQLPDAIDEKTWTDLNNKFNDVLFDDILGNQLSVYKRLQTDNL